MKRRDFLRGLLASPLLAIFGLPGATEEKPKKSKRIVIEKETTTGTAVTVSQAFQDRILVTGDWFNDILLEDYFFLKGLDTPKPLGVINNAEATVTDDMVKQEGFPESLLGCPTREVETETAIQEGDIVFGEWDELLSDYGSWDDYGQRLAAAARKEDIEILQG